MVIDNFALTMHQACPAKYDLRINQKWTSRRKSSALSFGSALHEGLAAWYKSGGNLATALLSIQTKWVDQGPTDDYRTLEKCLRVMMEYSKEYPTENFTVLGFPDNPLVENHFTLDTGYYLPLCPECKHLHPMTEPIIYRNCSLCTAPLERLEYGGIFDGVVEFSGRFFILEHKSTSMLGSYYFDQFKPNNQVTGYIWAARKLSGQPVGGALINAIGVYKVGATKFARQITTRSDVEISEWLQNVWYEAAEIQMNMNNMYWPQRTQACTMYGKCEYHSVHVLNHPKERERLLEQDFVQDAWDFVRRDEGVPTNG